MPNDILPEWERVLSAAAHLQRILPGAVLVGGSAYAGHRLSTDADHVLTDLRERFDQVLADLEAVAGWKTARIRRPVQILGSLDGTETGVRQLIREQPLETKPSRPAKCTMTSSAIWPASQTSFMTTTSPLQRTQKILAREQIGAHAWL